MRVLNVKKGIKNKFLMHVNDKMRRPGDDKHPLLLKSCNSFNAEKVYRISAYNIF